MKEVLIYQFNIVCHWSKLTRILMVAAIIIIQLAIMVHFQTIDNQQIAQANGAIDPIIAGYVQGADGTAYLSDVDLTQVDYMILNSVVTTSASDPTLHTYNNFPISIFPISVNAAHAKGVKILLGFYGNLKYGNSQIVESTTLLPKLIDNLADMVNQYGFDGIGIDWEGGEPQSDINTLLNALYPVMHSAGKLVTIAASWYRYDIGLTQARNSIDYIMPMCYDLSHQVIPNGFQVQGTAKARYTDTVGIMEYWIHGGYPVNKLLPGIAIHQTSIVIANQIAQWALSNCLAGVMIFDIAQSDGQILRSVHDALEAAPSPPTATSAPTPSPKPSSTVGITTPSQPYSSTALPTISSPAPASIPATSPISTPGISLPGNKFSAFIIWIVVGIMIIAAIVAGLIFFRRRTR